MLHSKSHHFMHLLLQRRLGVGDESLLGALDAGGWLWISKRSSHHARLEEGVGLRLSQEMGRPRRSPSCDGPIARLPESTTHCQSVIYKWSTSAVRIIVRQTICRSIRLLGFMNALLRILPLLAVLLGGCVHRDTRQKVSAAEVQQHIVGTWWCDHYSPDGPFYRVTFHPDGRWTSVSTNAPNESPRQAYWRVDTSGMLLVTKTRDALPSSNLEMFVPDSITERQMVFGQPSTAGRITFTK